MSSTTINFYDTQLELQRILFSHQRDEFAPTVIFFGGIHGNEPAGVYALKKVIEAIKEKRIPLTGNLYAIVGNLKALKKKIRFQEADLNRLWTRERVLALKESITVNSETEEQKELYNLIKNILSENKGPFYFIDLHTTSAETIPFITISDSLNNRKFASKFSVPVILGIEEFLEGPLLTFINEFGHISLGFEAGQHDDKGSLANCEAFIWQALLESNCIQRSKINLNGQVKALDKYRSEKNFFEINFGYLLKEHEDFMMLNDFKNFDHIHKNDVVALSNTTEIKAQMSGQIFMPLYQKQGKEGFFIISKISKFWIYLSALLRQLKLHHFLRLLPGIRQDSSNKYTLIVDPRTARFLATEIFHLFGYRKKIKRQEKLYFIKRDRKVTGFE